MSKNSHERGTPTGTKTFWHLQIGNKNDSFEISYKYPTSGDRFQSDLTQPAKGNLEGDYAPIPTALKTSTTIKDFVSDLL